MPSSTLRRAALAALLSAPALLAACDGPVAWDETAPATALPAVEPAPEAGAPADPARCAGSLAEAGAGGARYAVWWRVRADSTALLLAARREGDGPWSAPVPVDTADQGQRGCTRPPPAVAVDPTTGYVHVAYFLDAPEGAGIFFSHSMERGAMFHSSVGVVYGDRPSRVAVAARGDTVAVAYENPSDSRGQIGLALSHTDGHIFETHGVEVTSGETPASNPAVALDRGRVVVSWDEPGAPGGPPARRARVGVPR